MTIYDVSTIGNVRGRMQIKQSATFTIDLDEIEP